MAKFVRLKVKIPVVVAVVLAATALVVTTIVYALSLSDSYTAPEKIASMDNSTICSGGIQLEESSWTNITECNCNAILGWYWYETNGRGACWSKTLADTVSWNKGVGDDSDNPGAYTCATDVTALKDRMAAAAAGEWYKIVSDVNGVSVDSSKNGSSGYSTISALAISDCLDSVRDLCTGDGCLGGDIVEVNNNLKAWAGATGNKSALPYCDGAGCDSAVNSDYRAACEASINADLPLPAGGARSCYLTDVFFKNQKACNDGDANRAWVASASSGTNARLLGPSSCALVHSNFTSTTYDNYGFRAVLRP